MDTKTKSMDDIRKAIKKSGGGAESIVNLNVMMAYLILLIK